MEPTPFIRELEAWKAERLAPILAAGQSSLDGGATGADAGRLLEVALANELNVSELAALWMPTTAELEVKLAFARQAGDEASHFQLVADRLTALGFDVTTYLPPTASPLFDYLRGLTSTVERVAAGLFTLESIAHGVNQSFMAYCAARGDDETVRIYDAYIQPDELAHQQLGQRLLGRLALTAADQASARATVGRLIDLAAATRARAAARLGTACVPGC